MKVTIQTAKNYPMEQLVLPIKELIITGFEKKFIFNFFTKKELSQIALTLSRVLSQNQKDNLIIAEKDGIICGCLYYITKSSAKIHLKSQDFSFLSFFKQLKLFNLLHLLSHKPKKDELYIDFIVVSPSFQKQGIANKLLKQCKLLSLQQKITLCVAGDNQIAINLYKKEAFILKKRITSFTSKKIVGNKIWYFMEWSK